ncbi:MAG: hypothetical protein ACHP9Z_19565 [Streptosporangiales bacterium]
MIAAAGVVIPAHDEADLLPSCLAAVRLAAGTLAPVPVHLVVVADACTDQTAALRTAEDHGLVNALSAAGGKILRTTAVSVVTSARRHARAPHGFSHLLSTLAPAQP